PAPAGSGTAAFGVAQGVGAAGAYGTGRVGSGSMPSVVPRTGTAAFGTRPSGSLASVTGGASVVKPQNLTVMLTDIQGFTVRTSQQTHEQNARMLETHDGLLMPLLKAHEGRLVQKRGDALLVVFRSPTAGVACGMAMQDRLWHFNQTVPPEEQLHVRVCLHAGEVLVTSDTVLGEPMEVVELVEHVASADEVTFTEAVNLARNRAEVNVEPCGSITLPGREEQLQLYRCEHAKEGPPFGDRFASQGAMAAFRGRVKEVFGSLASRVHAVAAQVKGRLPGNVAVPPMSRNARRLVLLLGAVALLGGGAAWLMHLTDPAVRALALLEEGKKEEAKELLEAVPAEGQKKPSWQWARAAVFHAQGAHRSETSLLNKTDEDARATVDDLVLKGLAEDYGRDGSENVERLIGRFPQDRVVGYFEDLAEGPHSLMQWGALRYLEQAEATKGVDLVDAYVAALESKDCAIRNRAADQLAELGDADAIPALTRVTELPREKGPLGIGSKDCGQDKANEAINALKGKSN
ncbi:adenylate/guanylate cyclase domain-containing protein, partial [Pyxidicoccus sp. 3LG]